METNVNYTIAGIFVLVLLSFIILAIIWISSGLSHKRYTYYTVYMTESISGLDKNGPVEFNGVNVGNVYDTSINHVNPRIVELTLKVENDTPVTMGTRAKLGIKALTGVAFILLEDKGTDTRPVPMLAGEKYPVIPTTPSILVRLDTTLTQINESFKQVSTSIKALLDKENLKWFKQILQSGKGSLQMLEMQTIPSTNETLYNIDEIARNLNSVSSDIKENPAVIIRGKSSPSKLGPGER